MVDVVSLYPRIPQEAKLKTLREVLDKKEQPTIPTSELIRMVDFVVKNNYFEFNGQIKQQISIGTTFASPCMCCLWIKLKLLFLKRKNYSLWCGLDILVMFFISRHSGQEFQTWGVLMSSALIPNLHMNQVKKSIAFLDLKAGIKNSKIITDLYLKSTDCHEYLYYLFPHANCTKGFGFVVFSQ